MRRRTVFTLNSHSFGSFRAAWLLCGVVLFQGCGAAEKEPEPLVTVQVAQVVRGSISQTVWAEAIIFPLEQAVITAKISSTVHKFHVQRGSRVKKGQLLAELENADLAGAAEQSRGEFEQAEAAYITTTEATLPQLIQKAELDAAAAKSAFDAQKKVYDARKELFEQGAIPRRDMDSAEVGLAQARSQNDQAQKQVIDLHRLVTAQTLKSAAGQLSASKGKYLNAKAQLSYSGIFSPIDGVVTDRPFYEGELATANQPILTVMNLTKLIAKAHIAQTEAVQLTVGDKAEMEVPGVRSSIKGSVMLISPALDPGSTTVEVWVETLKPETDLKPGMNVSFNVTSKREEDTLIVPAAAVFQTPEGEDYVMLAGSEGKAHQTKVEVGIRNKEFVEIVSGIRGNNSVITVGGYALPDNTRIKIEPTPSKGGAEKNTGEITSKPGASPSDKSGKVPPAENKE